MIVFDPEKEKFPQRICVLVSGRGSNLQALLDNLNPEQAKITGVFSSDADQPALEIARKANIPNAFANSEFNSLTLDERDHKILETLAPWEPQWICLAGYRRLIGPKLLDRFPNRVLNIHPSLLPAFPGMNAQQKMLYYGVQVAGVTVHFVDKEVDHGPIVGQLSIPLDQEETLKTLQSKTLPLEHKLYSHSINTLLKKGCRIIDRRVEFLIE